MTDRDKQPPILPAAAYKPRIFYGWWIIFGAFAGSALSASFNFHGISAFFLPIANAFSVSRTAVATAISLARIEGALIGPLEGYLVDRFGPRRMMFIGVPIMAVGFLVMGNASNFGVFVGAFILGVVLGSSLGFGIPLSTSVANWWHRKRGRAFGIMWLGFSLASISVYGIVWLIETYDWRVAFQIMGVLVLVVGLPIAAIMRHRPEQYGLLPDGDDPEQAENSRDGSSVVAALEEPDFTIGQAIRTAAFWFFTISVSLRTGITTGIAINTFPLVEEVGGSSASAGLIFVLQGVCSAPGRLVMSWAGDIINKRYIMAVSLGVMSVALLMMSTAGTFLQLALLWVPYAIVWGGLSSIPQSFQADLFGRRNYGVIHGSMSPIRVVFSFGAPIFAAVVADVTDSYQLALIVFGILSLVAMVLIMFARLPDHLDPNARFRKPTSQSR